MGAGHTGRFTPNALNSQLSVAVSGSTQGQDLGQDIILDYQISALSRIGIAAGLLGNGLLSRYVVEIDFPQKTIRLSDPKN